MLSQRMRKFIRPFNLASLSAAAALGTVMGLLVLAVAPELPSWGTYRWALVSLMGLVLQG